MKNLFLILIFLFISINESQAQRNFGKRKFSRNLFSKNIAFKSKGQKEESKANIDLNIETKKEIEPVEIELNPIMIDELVHDLELIEVQEKIEKPKRIEIKKVEKAPKFALGMTEIIAKPSISKAKISKATLKNDLNKNSQSQKNDSRSDDFVDFLVKVGGWLLSAAICISYLLLLHYFPVITAIVTLILLVVGLIILINGIFDFFADLLSAMWH